MFSGGRDSTLAALELARASKPITLVTITSNHLIGSNRVTARLKELAPHLSPQTKWFRLRQPVNLGVDVSFYEKTCLPCHHAYVATAGAVARLLGCKTIAFGYASYQSDWPEQTPAAIASLRRALGVAAINLELPVWELASRDEAISLLTQSGLSGNSLEQKCLQQIRNVKLDPDRLSEQITLWEQAITASLRDNPSVELDILEQQEMAYFQGNGQ
ncbi:hypothetical protein [uncultured Brevundimonas sp.]|jgi:hypothetical protein|uniref:hypothetical protein n=1 Tax=uncultured Brevundimonas sp. TaxID=213418 RepID=UPI0025D28ED8|nr:hypothetical protein [uncultured Brevundimonas sp.]